MSFAREPRYCAVLLCLLLPACTSSTAGLDSMSSTERTFAAAAQTWDLNKDNVVTCDEWKAYTTELFKKADANHDGVVTQDEYAKITASDRLFQMAGFSFFDVNGDGKLTLEEFAGRPNPAFEVLDRNKDCAIDGNEIVQTHDGPPKPKETYGQTDGKILKH